MDLWLFLQRLDGCCRVRWKISIQFSSTHVLRTESRVVDDTLQGDLDRLWDLDSVGIRDKDTVLEAFEKNLNFEDGKYLVHLP